jgi:hypothetical protein
MGMNVTQKLISSHLVSGKMVPGEEIAIKIDQTLTQDATGTLVYLEVEAMGLTRTHAELSASYVDHNLLQSDFRNADDHAFLQSAAEKFGIHFSRPARKNARGFRFAHADRGRVGHARDWRRRIRCRARDCGRTVLFADAESDGRETDRKTSRLGFGTRCDSGNAAPTHGQRRRRASRRVLWAGTAIFVRA